MYMSKLEVLQFLNSYSFSDILMQDLYVAYINRGGTYTYAGFRKIIDHLAFCGVLPYKIVYKYERCRGRYFLYSKDSAKLQPIIQIHSD